MTLLFLFLDGIGLGPNDIKSNPFAGVDMPNMDAVLGGRKLINCNGSNPITTDRATFFSLDACLGIEGRPQSASGQASILTGKNIPSLIGQHFGPKPSSDIKAILEDNNLFSELNRSGYQVSFLNAFPEEYFSAIRSGHRIPGAFAMAALAAGIRLNTTTDLFNGNALSADFTAQGWHKHLNYKKTPVIAPRKAGIRLSQLSKGNDLTFFEYWLTDYAGHKRNMASAHDLLTTFDQVLGGLLSTWGDDQGLILITSDHGNLEDITIRNHTRNPVPAIVIGDPVLRKQFTHKLEDLTDIFPAVIDFIHKNN